MSHTGTLKWAFLNKSEQSNLKPAHSLLKTWECLFQYVMHHTCGNLNDYHIQQSSTVKLFSAQRKREKQSQHNLYS
jgi:hypothetical protein